MGLAQRRSARHDAAVGRAQPRGGAAQLYTRGAYDECGVRIVWTRSPTSTGTARRRPRLYSSGWYDAFALQEVQLLRRNGQQNRSPQRLIMGPWTHMTMRGSGSSVSGDVDFAPMPSGETTNTRGTLALVDRWLKDIPTRVEEDPPVGFRDGRRRWASTGTPRLSTAGNGETRTKAARPGPNIPLLLPLRPDSFRPELPASDAQSRSYTYDPDHPVPTIAASATGFFKMVRFPQR